MRQKENESVRTERRPYAQHIHWKAIAPRGRSLQSNPCIALKAHTHTQSTFYAFSRVSILIRVFLIVLLTHSSHSNLIAHVFEEAMHRLRQQDLIAQLHHRLH